MPNKTVTLPNGQQVVLVPREQLRAHPSTKKMSVPLGLSLIQMLPPTPKTFSGSKNRAIKYPILGNDQEGDCYYADMCHCVQTFTGNAGTPASFDVNTVLARYERLSGGDNGLDDSLVFPEWLAGIVGPNGPHKILDKMLVDPANDQLVNDSLFLFCGGSWTCSLLTGWLNKISPGAVWDSTDGRPDPNAGHAMHYSGYGVNGTANRETETWAIDPAIQVTPAGMKAADPEVTVQFSMEMFDPKTGFAPHNGLHYVDLAAAWTARGGISLPPNPFPPPVPVPPIPPNPIPPIPTPVPGTLTLQEIVDWVFTHVETDFTNNPWILATIKWVHAYVDLWFSVHPARAQLKIKAGGKGTVVPYVDEVFALIEAGLTGHPVEVIGLQFVNGIIDRWLTAHGY